MDMAFHCMSGNIEVLGNLFIAQAIADYLRTFISPSALSLRNMQDNDYDILLWK